MAMLNRSDLIANTQVLIPMSGFGQRFKDAGYNVPKPLIPVEGKPMIAHVADMYKGSSITFVCNENHLAEPNYQMEPALVVAAPNANIIGIAEHKLGPGHALLAALPFLDPDRPVLVSYCDFCCIWNYGDFLETCERESWDGCIPSYKGFHPHCLGSTNYAYLKMQSSGSALVEDIREKQPWTDNRMNEFASAGIYWFKSGKIFADALREQIARNIHLNGEFYISLTYKPMFEASKKVGVYPLKTFFQWGTPEDLAEFEQASDAFRKLSASAAPWGKPPAPPHDASFLMPMAGLGERFSQAGYPLPKPLIQASGLAMGLQSVAAAPEYVCGCALMRTDMQGGQFLAESFSSRSMHTVFCEKTSGQAHSLMIAAQALLNNFPEAAGKPVWIAPCDAAVVYDSKIAHELAKNYDFGIVASAPPASSLRKPASYGWISPSPQKDGSSISSDHLILKRAPEHGPKESSVITGAFFARSPEALITLCQDLLENGPVINGEHYADALPYAAQRLGMSCCALPAVAWHCFGTPDELNAFEYWQCAFHAWKCHPYRIWNDPAVPDSSKPSLVERLSAWNPKDCL